MKKLLAILLALILCVGTLSVVSFAAQTTTVHAYVPSDWNKPNVYGWFSAEGNPNWPGDAMTQEEGQWYTGTIDATNDRVIINNDSGSPQTVDLELDAGYEAIWVVVTKVGGEGKFEANVYYSEDEVQLPSGGETPSTPDTPDTPDAPADDYAASNANGQFAAPSSLAIVGTGIPGVGEWNPGDAAGTMTANGLVYEITLSCPAGTNMKFKFAGNGAWDDTCNLGSGTATIGGTTNLVNDGGSSDMALTVSEDCVLKFIVDLTAIADKTGAATLAIELVEGEMPEPTDPTEPAEPTEPADPEGTVKVHARIPESWGAAPCFWAWNLANQTNAFDAWPGNPMTKNGEWFEIEIPNWCDGVIVNDGGSTQTADLTVEAGKEVWLDVYATDNVVITYSEPGEREEPAEPDPTTPSETKPTEPTVDKKQEAKEQAEKELKAKKKTHTILIIVMVVVWVVVIAELITILLKKKF